MRRRERILFHKELFDLPVLLFLHLVGVIGALHQWLGPGGLGGPPRGQREVALGFAHLGPHAVREAEAASQDVVHASELPEDLFGARHGKVEIDGALFVERGEVLEDEFALCQNEHKQMNQL